MIYCSIPTPQQNILWVAASTFCPSEVALVIISPGAIGALNYCNFEI
jgi:hypothetical protein